ncbi:MAG: hypothetical protein IJT32_02355 [Lachnospiraceae bacterium]|nr:hypothetical protein [Lachnospiraceae bacterium]
MSQLITHYAQSAIVFVTVFLIFALLFAVFPKEAWTDAYRAGDGISDNPDPSGSTGTDNGSAGSPAGASGDTPVNDSAGSPAGTSEGSNITSPLSAMHAATPAPKPGIADITVAVGQPVALTDLVTADGSPLSASGSRYTITLHDAIWLGEDGSRPDASLMNPDASPGNDAPVTLSGNMLTFPHPGIYRIRITVGDTAGFTTTAYLYCHAVRKGFS